MLESLIIGLGMFALTLAVQMVLVVYFSTGTAAPSYNSFGGPRT